MPPATVLIYGAAKGGTPVMLAAPLAALDLPLRVLVREREDGVATSLSTPLRRCSRGRARRWTSAPGWSPRSACCLRR